MSQDPGNSVYTVMMPRAEFKRAFSVELVVRALRDADIDAAVTPRFDIAVGGKKIGVCGEVWEERRSFSFTCRDPRTRS